VSVTVWNYRVQNKKGTFLSVILHGCGNWPLKLKEEHKLRMLENVVLRKKYGSKRDEVARICTERHKKEIIRSVSLTKCHLDDHDKNHKTDLTCSMDEGEEKRIQSFGGET
jgi:glycyl-tRNA synthetase beta subunit